MSDGRVQEAAENARVLQARGPEIVVSACLAVAALFVLRDSLRVGIGWADDGPRSGYFPFYIGLLLLGASLTILAGALFKGRSARMVFAEHGQLASVFAVLVPMTVYIGAIAFIGIYASSALLIGYFMLRHGRFGWAATVAVALGVPLVLFMVFERWFLVPLPKGPIERMLGF